MLKTVTVSLSIVPQRAGNWRIINYTVSQGLHSMGGQTRGGGSFVWLESRPGQAKESHLKESRCVRLSCLEKMQLRLACNLLVAECELSQKLGLPLPEVA